MKLYKLLFNGDDILMDVEANSAQEARQKFNRMIKVRELKEQD